LKVAKAKNGKAALDNLFVSIESNGVEEFESDVAVSRDGLKLNTS